VNARTQVKASRSRPPGAERQRAGRGAPLPRNLPPQLGRSLT